MKLVAVENNHFEVQGPSCKIKKFSNERKLYTNTVSIHKIIYYEVYYSIRVGGNIDYFINFILELWFIKKLIYFIILN